MIWTMSKSYNKIDKKGTERHRGAEGEREVEVQRYKSQCTMCQTKDEKHLLQPSVLQTEGAR